MRIALWTLLALTLSTPTTFAQDPPWANKMFPDGIIHDFGTVPHGKQLFCRFKMTNIYDVPFDIMRVHASCGCVSAAATMKVLKRYETGYIEVSMDARRFVNAKTVTVFVDVGPQWTSTATLQVTANSRADVVLNPGEINFGVVQRGQAPSQNIDVEYAGVLDWRVTEVVKTSAPLEISLEDLYPRGSRPGQVGYRVKVGLKADAPTGLLKEEVLLKTNDPASPLVSFLVEANVQAPLTVSPATVNLGNLKLGEEIVKRVVVKAGKPFHIVAIDGLGEDIKVELPTNAAEVHILTLRCQLRQAGEQHRQLTVKTDLDPALTAPVRVEGTVVP